MDPTIDPSMMNMMGKGLSAPMTMSSGAQTMSPPSVYGSGSALPMASPGGGTQPMAGNSPQSNDQRNQIAAAMQAQQLAQQNQNAFAGTQANPQGINPMAQFQMPFDPNVLGAGGGTTGQGPTMAPSPQSYWG